MSKEFKLFWKLHDEKKRSNKMIKEGTKFDGVYVNEDENGFIWLSNDTGCEENFGVRRPTEAEIEQFAKEN